MTRYIRRASVFCLVLLVALLVNSARVMIFEADSLDDNPANRRNTIARYDQPRGNILVDGKTVTGSRTRASSSVTNGPTRRVRCTRR